MSLSRCDCLNYCGDDPDVISGRAATCEHFARLHPPKCQHCRGTGYEPVAEALKPNDPTKTAIQPTSEEQP